ncbi:hypothetical protein [Paludibacterium sp.]|uniref:hypothetical protein n=1 Tax=Paludibacterium sp. TaxID=1917523 RepID=UPI0025FC9D0B|nr:hypothetical protein [Paludibacterium sp.]MBV8649622.1 hypothetical protein [Paludibacterium sp.]
MSRIARPADLLAGLLRPAYGNNLVQIIDYTAQRRGVVAGISCVAVIINSFEDLQAECEQLAEITMKIIEQTGHCFSIFPIRAAELARPSYFARDILLKAPIIQ